MTPPVAGARTILHVDMDAFFVAVEVHDDPALAGRPVVVGGEGARGVVAAASYEARAYGVHSAMPSLRARRLCPDAVFVAGRYARYQEVSGQVRQIFGDVTPLVEPISLDEAFLDVTGARALFGDGATIGRTIRERVAGELGLACSVGVAPRKLTAKLASEAAKPGASRDGAVPGPGVVVVTPDDELAFLHRHPVEALWGVGPATLARLARLGVRTVGELADLPEATVVAALGAGAGRHLHALAWARDERPVVADRAPKSLSHEETFATDLVDPAAIDREAVRLADAVATRLRRHHLAGRTVQVKVRFGDFRTVTRATTLPEPVDNGPDILRAARTLLAGVDPAPGIRLLGIGVSHLGDGQVRQLSLDGLLRDADTPSAPDASWDVATRAVDRIRERFGDDAIVPAALAGRVKRQGEQQWGPG